MIKSYRIYSIIIISILMFSGCQLTKSTTANSTSVTSSNNTGNASASTQNSTSSSSTNSATAPVLNVIPGNAGKPIRASQIATDGSGNLYYCSIDDGSKISTIKMSDTTDLTAVTTPIPAKGIKQIGNESASEILLLKSTIYYTNKSDSSKIYSINTDGTNKTKLTDEAAYNLVMIGNFIYYIDEKNIICVYDISSNTKFSLNISSRFFSIDGDSIYFEMENQEFKNTLSSIKIDGTNQTKICDDIPTSIAAQSGVVYYTSGEDGNKIYSISASGGNITILNQASCSNLFYDNGWIYYINNTDFSNIYKFKPDGSSNTKLCSTDFVKSFEILGNNIYFNTDLDRNGVVNRIAK